MQQKVLLEAASSLIQFKPGNRDDEVCAKIKISFVAFGKTLPFLYRLLCQKADQSNKCHTQDASR